MINKFNINKIRMRSKIRSKIKAHNILFFNNKFNNDVVQLKKKLNSAKEFSL